MPQVAGKKVCSFCEHEESNPCTTRGEVRECKNTIHEMLAASKKVRHLHDDDDFPRRQRQYD
jgi:hypothetical protein